MDSIDRLRLEIEAIKGPVTRKKLLARRKELKKAHERPDEPSPADETDGDKERPDAAPSSLNAGQPAPTRTEGPIAAALLTPRTADHARLAKNYVHGGEPFCFRVGESMTDATTMMILSRLGELPRMADKLWYWKVSRFNRLILCKQPAKPDVTDAMVIAICGKAGKAAGLGLDVDAGTMLLNNAIDETLQSWSTEDPMSLCQRLLELIPGRRLHLFAQSATPGWQSVVGDANWSAQDPTA